MSDETKSTRPLYRILSWVITLLTPVALVLAAVRLMLTPAFLPIEYNMPGFPADPYGFTKEDRLYWSRIASDYLLNSADISFLGDLRFEDGTPVYNERELKHMVDVKIAIQWTLIVWYISLGMLIALSLWAWKAGWLDDYRVGLSRGGFLTAALLVVILLFVLLSFGVLFVAFHDVFFEPGTWMFNYSDTLIRLFPERFWQDIFIYVGSIAISSGLAIGFGLRKKV
ncbi:MAG: TIGR01906 family membrane protein [Anaerolineales bacterium]|nr:TIGR01906 family membrane protein [Anaerolineales bacterium]